MSITTRRVLLIGVAWAVASSLVGFFGVVAFNHEKIWPETVEPYR